MNNILFDATPHPNMQFAQKNNGMKDDVALAEFVDNSLDAGATEIEIFFAPARGHGNSKTIGECMVIDNGKGMNSEELVKAWQMAGSFDDERDQYEIGKFGVGLNQACLSKAKRVRIITKTANTDYITLEWDAKKIIDNGWKVQVRDANLPEVQEFENKVNGDSGTIVWLEDCDFNSRTDNLRNKIDRDFSKRFAGYLGGKIFDMNCELNKEVFLPNSRKLSIKLTGPNARVDVEVDDPIYGPRHSVLVDTRLETLPFARLQAFMYNEPSMNHTEAGLYISRGGRYIVMHKPHLIGTTFRHDLQYLRYVLHIDERSDAAIGLNLNKSDLRELPDDIKAEIYKLVLPMYQKSRDKYYSRTKEISDVDTNEISNAINGKLEEASNKGVSFSDCGGVTEKRNRSNNNEPPEEMSDDNTSDEKEDKKDTRKRKNFSKFIRKGVPNVEIDFIDYPNTYTIYDSDYVNGIFYIHINTNTQWYKNIVTNDLVSKSESKDSLNVIVSKVISDYQASKKLADEYGDETAQEIMNIMGNSTQDKFFELLNSLSIISYSDQEEIIENVRPTNKDDGEELVDKFFDKKTVGTDQNLKPVLQGDDYWKARAEQEKRVTYGKK